MARTIFPSRPFDRELRDAIPSFPCQVERDMHVSHSAFAMLVFPHADLGIDVIAVGLCG
jgi:hypothetical protein